MGLQQVFIEFVRELKLPDVDNPFTLVEESMKPDVAFLLVDLGCPFRTFQPVLELRLRKKIRFCFQSLGF